MEEDRRTKEGRGEDGARFASRDGGEPWREKVLNGMLVAAAVVALPLAALALLGRSSPAGAIDVALVAFTVLSVVALPFARGLPTRTRALLAILLFFGIALYFLARSGFVAGVVALLVMTSVLAVIYFGRALGFLFIGLTAAAFLVVGALVTRGPLTLSPDDLDPLRMRNWVRMGLSVAAVSILLVLAVEVVIRQVQAHAVAATAALADLRTAERDRRLAQERWQRGAEELIALGRGGAIESGDLGVAFRRLCEAGARGIEVERCSIWLFDEKAAVIRCENLFEKTPSRHSRGIELAAAEAPAYFEALKEARSLAVEDAVADPCTRELGPYLETHGVRSLLDAPIHFGGRVAGVVCHEHVGSTRAWSPDVRSFAASIADFASRALAAAERAENEKDLRAAYQQLGALHARLEAAKEEERRFLSHELHDELGQMLTALKLRLQLSGSGLAAERRREGTPDAPDAVALVDDLIARVRRISIGLRPPLLDEVGLVPALRAYLESQAALSGVTIDLEAGESKEGGGARLSPELEIACFRVVQESITNALRHASPRRLGVRVVRGPAAVTLTVRDDGRGFDPSTRLEAAATAGHLGVVGMRERVRACGGVFRLSSRPGAGTEVEVELPATPAGRA